MLKVFLSTSEQDKEIFHPRRRGSSIRQSTTPTPPSPQQTPQIESRVEKQPESQKQQRERKSIAQITTQLFPVDDHLYA
jgi:hypothetical protein